MIGCLFISSTSQSDDSWSVEFGAGSWVNVVQLLIDGKNGYEYIEKGFSASGECTGVLSSTDFRSVQESVDQILTEEHPVKLTKSKGSCADEGQYYIKVEHSTSKHVAAEYGFSSVSFCRAENFPNSIVNLATQLERFGTAKIRGKCMKEMALNPPNKPGFGTR